MGERLITNRCKWPGGRGRPESGDAKFCVANRMPDVHSQLGVKIVIPRLLLWLAATALVLTAAITTVLIKAKNDVQNAVDKKIFADATSATLKSVMVNHDYAKLGRQWLCLEYQVQRITPGSPISIYWSLIPFGKMTKDN